VETVRPIGIGLEALFPSLFSAESEVPRGVETEIEGRVSTLSMRTRGAVVVVCGGEATRGVSEVRVVVRGVGGGGRSKRGGG
jgi:hypothetical protein